MRFKIKDIELVLIRFLVSSCIFSIGMWLMAHQSVLSSVVGGVAFGSVITWLLGGTANCLRYKSNGESYIYIEPMRSGVALYYISIAVLLVGVGGFFHYIYITDKWHLWWGALVFIVFIVSCCLILYLYDTVITIDSSKVSVIHRFPLSSVERSWGLNDITKVRITLLNELQITFKDKRKVRINMFVQQNFSDLPEFNGSVRSASLLKLYRLKQEIDYRRGVKSHPSS